MEKFKGKLTGFMYIIVNIKNGITYPLQLSKITNITYSYIVKELKELEKYDFIFTVKKGRKKLLYLTKEGEKLKEYLLNVFIILNVKTNKEYKPKDLYS